MNLLFPLTTLTFAYPYVLLTPLLLAFSWWMRTRSSRCAPIPATSIYADITPSWRQRLRTPCLGALSTIFIACLSIAAARPQRVTNETNPLEARNLMLAIDVSRSMGTEDFDSALGSTSRLAAVKQVVKEFIAKRQGDRLGLVVFGSKAYLQAPLTADLDVLVQLVEELELGMAGDGTALGDGLGLSLKRLRDFPGSTKAVILLTDGVSNAGQVNPRKAADVAKDLGIKVHTIGVGSSQTVMRMRQGIYTQQSLQGAEYDEATLRAIAETTGGVFFNASSIEGLTQVYQDIDKLETTEAPDSTHRMVEELFPRYAEAALCAYMLLLILGRTIFLKLP
ncbi:MAG: VWA domain-containing protein [Oligoflexia bacterium]|nr:VWA domain-containing protein [Oligoflexia bacterium]